MVHKQICGVSYVEDCMLAVLRQNRVFHNQSELENHTKIIFLTFMISSFHRGSEWREPRV